MAASEPFPKAEECHPGRAFKRNFGRHGIVSAEHESRIVRVSRLTGGKDRHSKVLTYKGARDRRVRLSVSTAIQFYDLQDRLNLEQPSQVIDWLINEAKSAIEKLPALPSEAPSVTQITSSNGSPMKAARSAAITTAARTGIGAGPPVQDEQSKMQGIESPGKSLDRHVSHGSVQEPDMGRSTSSTSDGSVKAHFKFASKLATRGKSRHKEARQKAKERTQKKPYAVTKSPRLLNELLSLPSSESEQLNAGSHISILRAVSTSDGVPSTLQQLCNERGVSYSTTPYSQDSTQQNTLQQVFSSVVSSSPGILRSHLPSLCTFGSCSPQCHDVPDLSGLLLDEKDKFSAGSSFSAPQIQTSLPFSALVRNMEHPMAQHLPHVQRHISSAITPNMEFSDSMWNPSCRGPLQSNAAVELTTSSGMTNKTSVQDYDSRFSQGFHF